MSRIQTRKARAKAGVAMCLAGVGGFVDGVGYVVLFQLFTAHMSGNSVAMGVFLGREEWELAFHRFFPIPLFFAGIFSGAVLAETLVRRGARSTLAPGLALEIGLLLIFMVGGSLALQAGTLRLDSPWPFYPLAALPALAMGLQNATLRYVGGLNIRTTFISGILAASAEEAARGAWWLRDHAAGRHPRSLALLVRLSWRRASLQRSLTLLGIWSGYVTGAVLGSWSEQQWQLGCLVVPICGLAIIAVLDLVRPLADPRAVREGA